MINVAGASRVKYQHAVGDSRMSAPRQVFIVNEASTAEENRAELAQLLGVSEVSEAALAAALNDQEYALALVEARSDAQLVIALLQNPPPGSEPGVAFPSGRLLAKATRSFLAWTKNGFRIVTPERYAQRLEACNACPNSIDAAGAGPLQRVASLGIESLVCSLCGCIVERKAWMPHERCPDRNPADPAMSRWGEAASET